MNCLLYSGTARPLESPNIQRIEPLPVIRPHNRRSSRPSIHPEGLAFALLIIGEKPGFSDGARRQSRRTQPLG